jgi:Tol biopolymer transport system component
MRVLKLTGVAFLVTVAVAAPASSALALGEEATTHRLSVTSTEGEADGPSNWASISADGLSVVFTSGAALAPGGVNGGVDLRDRRHGATHLVSLSGDDRPVGVSFGQAVSADGRFVLFDSPSTIVGPGDGKQHVYLRDRLLGATRFVSPAPRNDGERGIDISPGGRFVTFMTSGSTPTTITETMFIRDRRTHTTQRLAYGFSRSTLLSGGRVTSGGTEVFYARGPQLVIWNRITGVREHVPLPAPAAFVEATDISSDGRFVLFDAFHVVSGGFVHSEAYLRDRQAGVTTRVSVGPAPFTTIVIPNSVSDDGRYVAFNSISAAFVTGDTNRQSDLFVRDMAAGETARVSVAGNGAQLPNSAQTTGTALSADGSAAVFSTPGAAVSDDTNLFYDVFVRGPLHG